MRFKLPNYLRFLFINIFCLFGFLFLLRIIFYFLFISDLTINSDEINKSLFLGLRFDLKLAIIAFIPLALFYILVRNFFKKGIFKNIYIVYTTVIYIILLAFYLFDYGHYAYLDLRLNANALRFLGNLNISTQFVFDTYPVYKGAIGFIIFIYIIIKINNFIYKAFKKRDFISSKKSKIVFSIITTLLLAFGIFSSVQHYPLRWSQAFFSKNKSVNQFTLNPVLYFFDSFKFRNESYDINETKKYAGVINKHLGIPSDSLLFKKSFTFSDSLKVKKPNVVFVMLESLGNASLGYYGNPLKVTPTIDSLLNNSVNFTNHYVPKVSTAASVFGSITGLPDVVNVRTASRNPMIINQRVLFDQFKGYKKLYFIGGSANWANIRAVFQSNIKGLKIYEEGAYKHEDRADVWGIDDYNLFKESNKELEELHKKEEPFVAFIQTATNHQPFTVPEKRDSFVPIKEIDESVLKEAGSRTLAQVNGIRYLDFNIKRFLERAKKSGYHDNTIFVFFGDHQDHQMGVGLVKHYKPTESKLGVLTHNVPLFIHAPKLLKPRVFTKHMNLVDMFPTTMALAKINYTNYTLGVNVLDTIPRTNFSFIYRYVNGEPASGVVQDSLFYYQTVLSKKSKLINLNDTSLNDISDKHPNKNKEMDSLLNAFYQSTKYLYFNNKK